MLLLGLIKMVDWDLLDEPWNELGDWTKRGSGTSVISPSGFLYQKPLGGDYVGRRKTLSSGLPTQYTTELRVKFLFENIAESHLILYDGEHLIWIILKNGITDNGIISCQKSDLSWDEIETDIDDNAFYFWRFVVNSSGHNLKVYKNQEYIGEFTSFPDNATNDGRISIRMNTIGESYTDYWKIASGLHTPSPSEHTNKTDCEFYGYYWWDRACYSNRSPYDLRAEKIAELHSRYGGGPYTRQVKEDYADCLVEVKQYNADGTWTSQNRRGKTRGYKDE